MYVQVASRLFVGSTGAGTVNQYSQAISMEGANALMADYVLINTSGTNLNALIVEEGNDLENWAQASGGSVNLLTSPNYGTIKVTGIASRYVRLNYRVGGTAANYSVLSAGVNTASL